ncbi:hypothetical protein SLS60_005714 [Paraconiothyrium brasiliense]|uniref:Heterokaryon incompatibility domain-containing protein n=1 Tax=Paraconiothyrium brasiliense TaxID=300254 RepID=A0ABR3RI58_9PLEO
MHLILEVSGSSVGVVSGVEEVMWGDSADISQTTIFKWWTALESAASSGKTRSRFATTRFWELLCADIFYEKSPSSSNVGVRRATPKDEITFMSWALESPRSPFNLRLYPNDLKEDEQEDWSNNTYYDRPSDAKLDTMSSQAASLWKSLLYLDMSTPSIGSLLHGLLNRTRTADDGPMEDMTAERIRIHDELSPFDSSRTTIIKKLAEDHNLYWGESVLVEGNIREDAPWTGFFWEIEDKLRTRFGKELVCTLHRSTMKHHTNSTQSLNTVVKTRQERVAAMDASIMAATLSRRLFFTQNGDVGLAPASTRPGDEVFYVAGGATPLLLRLIDGGGLRYEVVGDCYLLGMNEEEPSVLQYHSIYLV